MLNRKFKFNWRKKKKEESLPVTKGDLIKTEKAIREDTQKKQTVVEQKIETLTKLQTLTPRERLRLLKAQMRKGRRHG